MLKKYIKNDTARNIAEWIITILFAFLLFLFIQRYIVKNATVNGISMMPTLEHGDRVLLLRFPYYFLNPGYRDIIAFPYEENSYGLAGGTALTKMLSAIKGEDKTYYIKRIIGVPGDVIDLVDYRFTRNSEYLDDDFSNDIIYALGNVEFPVTVPADCYFVLGDNRNESKDSRYTSVGFVPKKNIVGRAALRVWPLNKIGLLY